MKVSAQAGAEVLAIVKANGGTVTAEQVVDAASDPNSALHGYFTWDDSTAALKQRLTEARNVIRQVYVQIVVKPKTKPMRVQALISLPADRATKVGYRLIEDVMSDPELRASALAAALADLEVCRKRYGHLQELAQVFAALDSVRRTKRTRKRSERS